MTYLDRLGEDQRRTEADLAAAWIIQAYPAIIGALLTEACEALRALPSVRLGTSPRMADFAVVLAALDVRHGTAGMTRYAGQARTLAEDTLDAEPVLIAMRETLTSPFDGTAAELLTRLTPTEERVAPTAGLAQGCPCGHRGLEAERTRAAQGRLDRRGPR